jgi:hypothetical protein
VAALQGHPRARRRAHHAPQPQLAGVLPVGPARALARPHLLAGRPGGGSRSGRSPDRPASLGFASLRASLAGPRVPIRAEPGSTCFARLRLAARFACGSEGPDPGGPR